MDWIYNIQVVAKFEIKTLLRSWFFRIFAVLSLVIIALFDLVFFTNIAPLPWSFRAIPSSIPYTNILFLNLAQAVIAVFLSSDFLKRDKKLDTTEVIYTKPVSNPVYIAGKTAGILVTFLGLNVAALIIAAVYNIFFAHSGFIPVSYLLYPLIISLPTIMFILGLSFLIMVVIRNQAVTFILLLGYIAATLFYLSSKFYRLFDYLSFNVPLMYSGITGFGNTNQLLIHRGIYLCLGISFIFITARLLKRLPQSKRSTRLSVIFSGVFLISALILSSVHINGIKEGEKRREEIIDINNSLEKLAKVEINRCGLEITHKGDKIHAEASLEIINRSKLPARKYIFNLNPGLNIEEIKRNGRKIPFNRNIHLIYVTPGVDLGPSAVDSLTIRYSGKIDENACYPDIESETINEDYRIAFMNIKKRYSFICNDYLLLTPETQWYPTSGPGFREDHPASFNRDFVLFDLKVKTGSGLTAVSQGKRAEISEGVFTFTTDAPLPGLSLVIGNYEKRSTLADSTRCNLYTIKGNDYFIEYFDSIGDTIPQLIKDEKQNYENALGLSSAYPRISLVEVPVQFYCYSRLWTLGYEVVQPEIVLLPEKGINIEGADFRRMAWRNKRRSERTNETTAAAEKQADMFRDFISRTLTGEINPSTLRRGPESSEISYSIFPFYYSFISHIESAEWPALNIALESYLSEPLESPPSRFLRFVRGITDIEKANIELSKNSLEKILKDPEKRDITRFVINLKGKFLFNLLAVKIGEEDLRSYIADIMKQNRFRNLSGREFAAGIEEKFGIEIKPYIDNWYTSEDIAGFVLNDITTYKFTRNERTRFQVRFRITNRKSAGGIVKITLKKREQRRFGRRRARDTEEEDSSVERRIFVGGNQTKEIGVVLNYEPRTMTVNTMISSNLPSTYDENFSDFELNKHAKPFEGERVVETPAAAARPGIIIVDNEDPGFKAEGKKERSLLKKIVPRLLEKEDEDKYSGLRFWESTHRWKATINANYYGEIIRSAHFTSSGDGNLKASWETEIAEKGYYDIYCYISKVQSPWRRRQEEKKSEGRYHYYIDHDDGVEEATVDLGSASEGWHFLGSYYFSRGQARIELSNETEERFVIADAVKWIKQ